MSSNSDDGDDDLVVLKCSDPHRTDPEADLTEIFVSTAEICSWDLVSILTHEIVTVKASRNRLGEHSSYFRGLLCGSFSESCLNYISIKWNLEAFMSILKFIFGFHVDVTFHNFVALFEGALFFGVEMLLSKCKSWLIDATSSKGLCSPQIQLEDLIHIWRFGIEHANDFIPELCTSYLARNFMWAIYCNSFPYVPDNLLVSSIKHPDLTIDSERHLANAFIVWLSASTGQFESLGSTRNDWSGILEEIRISLLPLWFAAGKRRCCYFSKFAEESIDTIFTLVSCPSTSMMNVFGDDDSCHLKIRLTKYTKKLDLSGCPQINSMILLMAMLPCSYGTDLVMTKVKQSSISLEGIDGDKCQIAWPLLPTVSFEAVEEVYISNCPRLRLEAAIECFCKSFPSLRVLKAAHYLDFKMTKLRQLVRKCPLLAEVDLTVDVSPVIPSQVAIVSSSPAITLRASTASLEIDSYSSDASNLYMSRALLSNVTKLTLEGRVDVSDYDLKNISEFCSSLCYLNLRGCTSVTDAGISVLVLRSANLHSLVVCDTSFGRNSVLALSSGIPNLDHLPTQQIEKKHAKSLAFKLQVLHMGGCNGVDEITLSELISETPMLRSLCLRETQIVDNTFHSFLGSSLEMLDVSDTKVSEAALAHIISRNPGLKCLKAKGCRNLFLQKSKIEVGDFPPFRDSCKEWYIELGKTCTLEEIAIGWGFSCFSLEVLKPAITTLRAITVGLGAALGHDALELLPTTCPLLEEVILYFQVISDRVLINIMESLRYLQVLALCHCLGEISPVSFNFSMPSLRKLRLERATPWMTNADLAVLIQNCANLIELSLLGCRFLNSDSQQIISSGWPGLISIHLEDCGEVTKNGVASLFDCVAVEDILLRHNGPGIQRNFILEAASKMPMLRKISLDVCDASEGDFDIPNFADRYYLSIVKIAKCKRERCGLDFQTLRRTPVHRETLVLVWDSKNLTRTVIKERV
ncbi:BTB/POZ domain-containing protein [Actinidia chinensis var. chinensis]|uniref:BTB/POZ domain-containing protein n=1 Tax=Actinidia chinensis var. chinensis TaxID=1590841 RepID=A0A2R6PXM9_ACTCC|nr:BTB/POZ domain-containing protein [Actinidia chinensis var. chinensis]